MSLENPQNLAALRTSSFYHANKKCQPKSWIDGVLFGEWMRELNRKFASKGRIVALDIDNCPAHPHIENKSNQFKLQSNYFSNTEHNMKNTACGLTYYQIYES